MPYETQVTKLARCAVGHHGELREVVFLRGNNDSRLVFADGTVIAPADPASLQHEYSTQTGYAEIAQELGGTHPFSLLTFGYQGTGPTCFATFLKAAGFNVSSGDIEQISPPVRLRPDGSRVSGTMGDDGQVQWADESPAPAAAPPAAPAPAPAPIAPPAPPAPPAAAVPVPVAPASPPPPPPPASVAVPVAAAVAPTSPPPPPPPPPAPVPVVAAAPAGTKQPSRPFAERGVGRIIVGGVFLLLFVFGIFGSLSSGLGDYLVGGLFVWVLPGVALILWGWFAKKKVKTTPGVVPGAVPGMPRVALSFDASGRVANVTLQQRGSWTFKQNGQARYNSQRASSLLEATEVLKGIAAIPPMTYYIVDTPDGSLGRDMNGYFTEGPLKTAGLRLATGNPKPDPVKLSSLTMFGDVFPNQGAVAALKQAGKYARLVLLMECGACGYQSPVETQAGDVVRECYACGATNSGQRGNINVMLNGGAVEI